MKSIKRSLLSAFKKFNEKKTFLKLNKEDILVILNWLGNYETKINYYKSYLQLTKNSESDNINVFQGHIQLHFIKFSTFLEILTCSKLNTIIHRVIFFAVYGIPKFTEAFKEEKFITQAKN